MKTSFGVPGALLFAIVVLTTAPSASAQGVKPVVAKQRSTKAISLPAGGKLVGGLYSNSQYKLELQIPQGFSLAPASAEDDKRGAELMAGGDERRKQALEAANKGTTNLIEVTVQKPGVFRSVSLLAEDVSSAPLVESGKDYTNHVMAQLRASKLTFKVSDGGEQNLDGRSFSTKALEMQMKGVTVYQAYSATVVDRTALVMILTSESSAGLRELMASFKPHFLEPLAVAQKNDSRISQEDSTAYVKNGVYTNPYFKLNFRVPEGWSLREGAREAVRRRATGQPETAKVGMDILFIATPPESTNSVMMMSVALNGSRITPAAATESMILAAQKRGFQPVSQSEEKKISGQRFSRSVLKGYADGMDVYQAYSTAVLRDHLLCFVVTAHDTEQLDNLLAISAKNLDID